MPGAFLSVPIMSVIKILCLNMDNGTAQWFARLLEGNVERVRPPRLLRASDSAGRQETTRVVSTGGRRAAARLLRLRVVPARQRRKKDARAHLCCASPAEGCVWRAGRRWRCLCKHGG